MQWNEFLCISSLFLSKSAERNYKSGVLILSLINNISKTLPKVFESEQRKLSFNNKIKGVS